MSLSWSANSIKASLRGLVEVDGRISEHIFEDDEEEEEEEEDEDAAAVKDEDGVSVDVCSSRRGSSAIGTLLTSSRGM